MPQTRQILRYRQLPLPEYDALERDLKPQAAGVLTRLRQPAEMRRQAFRYSSGRSKAVPPGVEVPIESARGVQNHQEIDIGVRDGTPPCRRAEEHDALQVRPKLVEDGLHRNRIRRAACANGRRRQMLSRQRGLECQDTDRVQ